ncbi:MAG: peptide ABC transporter substrate-binding protein [Oscillospiraceae bacterium]|nr:peptide ABC transporter substrate-binding protein [Oscillospiraceae bacterium]
MLKKLICFALVLSFVFSGCSAPKTLGFDMSRGVDSFDPQLAGSDPELIIVENCFQGLLDKDENGTLIPGAAEKWEVSENGLVYTFYLRKNLFWSDGETPVTADDFLFAFERLFSPETSAPSRSDFFNIENSEKVLSGTYSKQALGIKVIDKHTLTITLQSPDPLFPDLLTNAAAMPCNRKFFEETRGRYGLGLSYTIFNGAYYVRRINNYSYVLSPNEHSPIANEEYENVYLFVKDDPKADAVNRLLEETVDCSVINPSDKDFLIEEGFDILESENTTWAMAFNTKDEVLKNNKIRRAISYAIDKTLLAPKIEENFRIAEAFVPPCVTLNGEIYRETVGEEFAGFEFDPKIASDLFKEGLEELGLTKLTTLTIICTEEFIPAMGFVQKSVQDNLAVFINLVPVTEEELDSAVASGNYDLALVPITPQYDNPSAVFSLFTDSDNITGFYHEEFSKAVNSASQKEDYMAMAESFSVAEQMLLQAMPALPLFYETSYFAVSPRISGLDYSVYGGHITFRFCE